MKEKFKAHFLKFGPRQFVIFTVLALFITDLINCYYLKLYWMSKDLSMMIVRTSATLGQHSLTDFSPDSIDGLLGLINNAFYFFLFVILLNNLVFYLFYLRRKLWAQGYILFYVLTNAVMQLTFVTDSSGLGMGWTLYNLLTVPFYVYLFLGVKWLKAETTDFVPVRGKMAQ